MEPVYFPKILKKMEEICDVFGVCPDTVRKWASLGAPIAIEGQGVKRRYSTEMVALQCWRLNKTAPA